MADVGEDIELGEVLLILLAVGLGIYFLKKAFTFGVGGLQSLFCSSLAAHLSSPASGGVGGSASATITDKGVPSFSGPRTGNPTQKLTAGQARSISISSGHGQDYTISPDGLQVWFFDGSYYDNPTGQFFSAPCRAAANATCAGCTSGGSPCTPCIAGGEG